MEPEEAADEPDGFGELTSSKLLSATTTKTEKSLDSDIPVDAIGTKKEKHVHTSKYRYCSGLEEDDEILLEIKAFEEEQSSESIVEEEVGLVHRLRLSALEQLAAVPDIESISSSSTFVYEDFYKPRETQSIDSKLKGKFVDPLTGLDIEEQVSSDKTEDLEYDFVDMDEFAGEETEEPALTDITEDSELLELEKWDADREKIEETKLVQPDYEIIDFGFDKQTPSASELDFEQALREETQRQNEAIVNLFVENLIDLVVDTVQYKDPREILRKSIDKRKLMDEINEKLGELESEQMVRACLHQGVVKYHKRKGLFRAIMSDTPKSIEYFMGKFQEQLQKYDEVMGKEEELMMSTKVEKEHLKEVVAEKERTVEAKVKEFEDLVRKVLLPFEGAAKKSQKADKNFNYCQDINALLNQINTARMEISNVRFKLIKKQHLYAELKEKLSQMQKIGDGLCLSQFENLQNEVKQLGKKTDERNTELSRAQIRRQFDVHISTHLKERTLMMRSTLSVQKLYYQTLLEDLEETRRQLNKERLLRDRMRKETRECYFQGGLLLKPALMLDYDNTVEEVNQKSITIYLLHNQYKKINAKVAQYEKLLQSGFTNKLKVND
ncbi:coiled-coil domain-containing protein 96-like isoform X1 [Anastrepha obliqua]|uniref:coiled-coil domain-containing protein 96-like isoform X1 n=1 Tax=Anastrepha obliqua TaxID=95512 RepID=UPI0024098876|nr:coiled-coil domain-containing protein 96-like isoform X1 [Anastrepha obliqua]